MKSVLVLVIVVMALTVVDPSIGTVQTVRPRHSIVVFIDPGSRSGRRRNHYRWRVVA